jgi:hypothetical protein
LVHYLASPIVLRDCYPLLYELQQGQNTGWRGETRK